MSDLNQDNPVEPHNSVEPHILRMFAVYGLTYFIIYADHTSSDDKEGYMEHTIGLAKGDGSYESTPGVIHIDDRLKKMGISGAYPRRDDPTRYVLLLTNKLANKYTVNKMMEDLKKVKTVTEELNDSIDPKLRDEHKYDISLPVLNMAFGNKTSRSLDHFLDDHHVIEVMENCSWFVGPNFAQCTSADIYFNPERETYPEEAHKYGFNDKSSDTPPTKTRRLNTSPREWFVNRK